MPLPKEEADALRHCSRILSASLGQPERRHLCSGIERFIGEGRWPKWRLEDISRLFYPNNPERERNMLTQMLKEFGDRPRLALSASDLSAWAECPPVPRDSPLRFWLPKFMQEVDAVSEEACSPGVKANKIRRNSLDPAIDKAINLAGNMELADVYLQLKELAIQEEKPFTGIIDGESLCYTNDNDQPDKLTKNALGKRLKNRSK